MQHVKTLMLPQDFQLMRLAGGFHPDENWIDNKRYQEDQLTEQVICHQCGQPGHKSTYCQEPKIEQQKLYQIQLQNPISAVSNLHVTCFHCGVKGHYASFCPQRAGQLQPKDGGVVREGRILSAHEREKEIFQRVDTMKKHISDELLQDNDSVAEDSITEQQSQPIDE